MASAWPTRIARLSLALCATSCAHQGVPPNDPSSRHALGASESLASEAASGGTQEGLATWYGPGFEGHKTASGERLDSSKMTAAHRTLRFNTLVEVTRVDTGEAVVVRITDRGPFGSRDRIIDLSRAAAAKLGMLRSGVAEVRLRVVSRP